MRKLILVLFAAFLSVPALAVAKAPPSPTNLADAQKQCATMRQTLLAPTFKATFGTNANKSNAFGKCVSARASANAQNDSNAAAQCRAERSTDAAAFAAKYGDGPHHKNAFGRCVSFKAKAAASAQVAATINAAKQCKSERQANPTAFQAKYGPNTNKANAFGKCVSSKVKQSG